MSIIKQDFGKAGNINSVTGINRIMYSNPTNDRYVYGGFNVDCTKFSNLKFKLTLSSVSFSGSGTTYYLRFYNSSDTNVNSFSTSAGDKELALDPSWGSTAYVLVYAVTTAAYGKVTFEDIELTPI